MAKIAFKMQLKDGFVEEYKKRHSAVWPEIIELLKANGVTDYSIYIDEQTHTLFAIQSISSDKTSQDLTESPIMKKWWAYMQDIMLTNKDNSPTSSPLEPVFHMD